MKTVTNIFNTVVRFIGKNKNIIMYLILGVVIVWLLSLKTCNKNSPYTNQQTTIDSLTLANQTKDIIINKKNQEVVVQTAIVVASQKTIDDYANQIFDLKKKNSRNTHTTSIVSVFTSAQVDSLRIKYKDTLAFKKFSDSVNKKCADVIAYMKESTITVPRPVEDSTKDFVFKGTIAKTGFTIDHASFPDSTYIRFVTHKGGLFKRNSLGKVKFWTRKSIEVQVLHTNPLIKIGKVNSVFYVPRVKQRWGERIAIIAATAFITLKLLK